MLQIHTFQYKPEDVDCTLCTKYGGKKRGCTVKICPWLAERMFGQCYEHTLPVYEL